MGRKLSRGRVSLFVLLALGLTSGCLGGEHTFYVDKRFTGEEEKSIRAAADSWAAVGAEPMELAWGERVDVADTGRRVLVRATSRTAAMVDESARLPGVAAIRHKMPGAERILLLMDRVEEQDHATLQAIVAHELGHHYGIHHEDVPRGNLMSFTQEGESPTPADVRALLLAR